MGANAGRSSSLYFLVCTAAMTVEKGEWDVKGGG